MSDKRRPNLSEWIREAKGGSVAAFAKLLTWCERTPIADVYALKDFLNPDQIAFRIGITGPPGSGKSTLVSGLIGELRKFNLRVGVLAIDPSSPFTGGAILGDRIRYQDHFLDDQVFIRSLGTRGSLGGLSAAAHRQLRLFDLCEFDVVLVETVGVGQTELDVLHVADQVAVVLVPESGDSIQAMKAGLMEVADLFLVNKADRPGAMAMAKDIESSFVGELDGKTPPQVYLTEALNRKGLEPVVAHIMKHKNSKDFAPKRNSETRLKHEARMILRAEFERQMESRIQAVQSPGDLLKLLELSQNPN